MKSGPVASASKSLSDDLYVLYLAAIGWLLFVFYGAVVAEILPSQWTGFEAALSAAVVFCGGAAVWIGARGGPLIVPRAAMIHELGSPVGRRRLLLPRLVRQTVAWAVIAADLATLLLVLADGEGFRFALAIKASAVAALATGGALFQATSWLVVLRGADNHRVLKGIATIIGPLVVAAFTLVGGLLTSETGLAVLAATTLWSIAVGAFLVAEAPIETLWNRAQVLTSLGLAAQTADVRRIVLDARMLSDQPAAGRSATLGLSLLPTQLWRYLAAARHVVVPHVARLGISLILLGLLLSNDVNQGIVMLGVATCVGLLGFELSGPLAATVDHQTLAIHYRQGSGPVLRAQMVLVLSLVIVLAGVVAGAAVAFGGLDSGLSLLTGLLLVAAAGGLSATVQARLGSPDVATMVDRFGSSTGAALWLRALAGPLLLFAVTVAVFYQYVRPEYPRELDPGLGQVPWGAVIGILLFGAIYVSVKPLERRIE